MAFASAMLAGKEKTVTAPHAKTPACPASACCAVAGVIASAAFVSALNLVHMELPVKNAQPVLIPALSNSKLVVDSKVIKQSNSYFQVFTL